MPTSTIVLLIISLMLAIGLVYFQYVYREKKYQTDYILYCLRLISIFSILTLLINPQFQQKFIETLKPKLLVAIDNSLSITYLNQDVPLRNYLNRIIEDKDLLDKFEIEYYTFGSDLKNNQELSFKDGNSDLHKTISGLNAMNKKQVAPILLLSDGNQTFGMDYKYLKSDQPIFPVIFGDTLKFADIEISRINVNPYSFLKNNFPVEIFLKNTGDHYGTFNLIIEESNQIIFKKPISFSKNQNSVRLEIKLAAEKIGKHFYQSRIEPLENEQNTNNNIKNFSVEIIDEKSNIAIVYEHLHPDIGMLKRSIESNKQRNVILLNVNSAIESDPDPDLYILYQPNDQFDRVWNLVKDSEINYMIITGKQTDWNFLNSTQTEFQNKASSTTENYFAVLDENFNHFKIENIGFDDYPPLEGFFGEITFSVPYETILKTTINGVETNFPLMASYSIGNNQGRRIVLFGENIWKWRSSSYSKERTFEYFDDFINRLIQYLTLTERSNPIELSYKPFYYTNESIVIRANIFDSNFNIDTKSSLQFKFKDDMNIKHFYVDDDHYKLNLADLKSGSYPFEVKNTNLNKSISGAFNVLDYSVEQERMNADIERLSLLALNSNGKVFFPQSFELMSDYLMQEQNFAAIQKEKIKTISLIDWKWLLGIIIVSLSSEWFIRKYRGLI